MLALPTASPGGSGSDLIGQLILGQGTIYTTRGQFEGKTGNLHVDCGEMPRAGSAGDTKSACGQPWPK